ncbi:MAG: tRNA (adenosine(37)-N6)-dimethylallyltransferase MiaA [Patescibacteria group bacterium]|nr:tRNA (adenosine(37)-N6)-dimethylallyltransferase MiaA [Patescibacteria group bacterium]MDD4304350.1 tRNA (adenosine(37)-N6)-dimethylallyltransferase MiaA [Patescibacteria group bacterium]MDD4695373.1 tRNA (adenosine(37)-N6)-dimethylallyltransferase MiaA [Patescibacteria group bacterium]
MNNKKIICIVGPTACGKTKLGVRLARKFNGEIISADSRQVYTGMDIGTGKDLKEYGKIPYHIIDISNPKKQVTLSLWQNLAIKKIKELQEYGKIPFVVGGTGLYINSIVDGYILNDEKINKEFRKKLNSTSLLELQKILKKLDKIAYSKIDINNKRRIIRAIEIVKAGSSISKSRRKKIFDSLVIGITFDRDVINKRIDKRLKDRIADENMIEEIAGLKKLGLSWKRLEDFGLEYRYVGRYLKKELEFDEMINQLEIATHQFAKRQMTWFHKRKDIIWVKDYKEAEKLVSSFLNK